jgi:predicted enzyme related to lactoylglutathione lyase
MITQINHVAIITSQYSLLGKFYEAVFGLKTASTSRPAMAVTVGDGYTGINIIPQRDGYVGGLDHFGMVVDDVETVLSRINGKYPDAAISKRPSSRPFAAYSGHDPDGNLFDLAQRKEDTRSDIYHEQAAPNRHADRYVNKFAIRTPHAEKVADFYVNVFGLEPKKTNSDSPGYHLTDGRMTLAILPWSIPTFAGMFIKRTGPDHIGFSVENIEAFKADLQEVVGINQFLTPMRLGGGVESDVRKRFFESSATGAMQMADPIGIWIDITGR